MPEEFSLLLYNNLGSMTEYSIYTCDMYVYKLHSGMNLTLFSTHHYDVTQVSASLLWDMSFSVLFHTVHTDIVVIR